MFKQSQIPNTNALRYFGSIPTQLCIIFSSNSSVGLKSSSQMAKIGFSRLHSSNISLGHQMKATTRSCVIWAAGIVSNVVGGLMYLKTYWNALQQSFYQILCCCCQRISIYLDSSVLEHCFHQQHLRHKDRCRRFRCFQSWFWWRNIPDGHVSDSKII